ncbi:hypothetical protein ACFYOT_33455 [Saccharothrix saharensis]|uniref:hypothetical protein n=1 Tax=Saccharothrix saharensis TaxID=571190 RepID=UPI0036BF183B
MVGRVARWRSPWWTATAALVPVTLTAWAATPPGGYFTTAVVASLCWLAVGLAWLVTAGAALVAPHRPRLRQAWRLWPFLLVPALLVATHGAVDRDLVGRAAFAAHQSALEALVAEPDRRLADQRVGLFEVDVDVDRPNGCTVLTVAGAGLLGPTGWAHCPDRVPVSAKVDGYKYAPLDGPWYEFTLDW